MLVTSTIYNEAHANIIDDIKMLEDLGYSVWKYLKDLGINKISIYCDQNCLDIFKEVMYQLKFEKQFMVEGYYSNNSIEFRHKQSINFGMVYFNNIFVSTIAKDAIVVSIVDGVNAPVKSLNFYQLVWNALSYATIFRPIIEYKKLNPSVQFLCVNYPSMPPKEASDAREIKIQNNKTDYYYVNLLKNIPDTFNVFDYSREDIIEVFNAPQSELDVFGKRHYNDYKSKNVNIVNGHRVTMGQMEAISGHRIYMLGGCSTFGYGCSDGETSSSYLQELLNEHKKNYMIENYGMFLNYRRKDLYDTLFSMTVNSGDIIIMEVWNKIPDFCKEYIDFLDLKNLFFRPHNFGDVFVDYSHYSYLGQKAIAQQIYQKLVKEDFYISAVSKRPTIEFQPVEVFGIPNNLIIGGGDDAPKGINDYIRGISNYRLRVGAIVMNCNPFTLGHRYLIETAANQCDRLFVFVVEEDKSVFKFEDRLKLVVAGTSDFKNVIVLPSGRFMISSLTFSDYFNKSKIQDKIIDSSQDVNIFAKYIAPALNINVRFAGEEPLDKVTKQYNETMKDILPKFGIKFVEIPRKEFNGDVISASRVRKLLTNKNFDEIKKIVPQTTYEYLINNYSH